MPFSEFMRAALYEPGLGYYTSGRDPWGPTGDYFTAPQIHPALGIAIARLAVEVDAALEDPDPFTLAELGSGDGRLTQAVLDELAAHAPATYARTRLISAEAGDMPRSRQARLVEPPPRGFEMLAEASGLSASLAARGLVYSNELLDAMPVERLRLCGGELQRGVVVLDGDTMRERFEPCATGPVVDYLRDNDICLGEGQLAEVCLGVEPWVASVARALDAGALLTIDYGHETAALYGPARPRGTLVCQHEFQLGDDPLLRPGEQDITAHVDFGNLRRTGRASGLLDHELCSLRVFLVGMGVAAEPQADVRQQLALRHLLVSEIADTHKLLLQTKGLDASALRFGRQRLQGC